jgi:hypothetical protein
LKKVQGILAEVFFERKKSENDFPPNMVEAKNHQKLLLKMCCCVIVTASFYDAAANKVDQGS